MSDVYVKKPVSVKAVRLTEQMIAKFNEKAPREWLEVFRDTDALTKHVFESNGERVVCLSIETLEGRMCANAGDWIVRGVEGEIYPVKDSVFQKTYVKAPGFLSEDAPPE